MKIGRTKYVLITKKRPTMFLTCTGELSEKFDEAMILESFEEVEAERAKLDEPNNFDFVPVRITVEV